MRTIDTSHITAEQYKEAAKAQLWFSKMARLYGDNEGARNHCILAGDYIRSAKAKQ